MEGKEVESAPPAATPILSRCVMLRLSGSRRNDQLLICRLTGQVEASTHFTGRRVSQEFARAWDVN